MCPPTSRLRLSAAGNGLQLGFGPAEPGQTARALALHQRPECFADQLGAFSQTTDLLRLREQLVLHPGQGELLLSRELREVSQAHDAQAVVVGTYAVSGAMVYVSLKLVHPQGNQVVAASDYALALDDNLRGLLQGR